MGRAIRAVAQDQDGAAADGRQPGPHQAMGVRHRHRRARHRRGALDHRRARRADARPRLYRPDVLRRGDGGARQHDRHADRRHHPRRRRIDRAHDVRRVLGAGRVRSRCCLACWRCGRRACSAGSPRIDHGPQQHRLLGRGGGLPGHRPAADAGHPQRVSLLRRLRDPAVHRARRGVEHPRRLCRLREFRHQRLLRRRRLHGGVPGQGGGGAAAGADRHGRRHRRACSASPSACSPCACAASSSRSRRSR